MDEPTTGMDPGNRRHVWNMIGRVKKGRVIILTTHSMEEADVLGDQIAIMVSGGLKCIGSSLHLKTKFGTGYKIRLVTPVEKKEETKKLIQSLLPVAKLEDEAAGSLTYTLPSDSQKMIPKLFAEIEQQEGLLINDWGISQTTLEDVFLHLTRKNSPKPDQGVTRPVLTPPVLAPQPMYFNANGNHPNENITPVNNAN